jgi:hypothetical protein
MARFITIIFKNLVPDGTGGCKWNRRDGARVVTVNEALSLAFDWAAQAFTLRRCR